MNNQDSDWDATFSSSMAAGSYCDVTTGNVTNGACTGTEYVANHDFRDSDSNSDYLLSESLSRLAESSMSLCLPTRPLPFTLRLPCDMVADILYA